MGPRFEFPNQDVLQSLKIVFTLANIADPDEMSHSAAFHLGFHCLQKYQFREFQYSREVSAHLSKQGHNIRLNNICEQKLFFENFTLCDLRK